jgi:hypothetical protein
MFGDLAMSTKQHSILLRWEMRPPNHAPDRIYSNPREVRYLSHQQIPFIRCSRKQHIPRKCRYEPLIKGSVGACCPCGKKFSTTHTAPPTPTTSLRAAEDWSRREQLNCTPRRSLPYTNRYTNLGVMERNTAIRCGHFSL